MLGSLDNPPIVIAMSRGKIVLLLLVSVVFVAGGVFLLVHDPQDPGDPHNLRSYLCILFFGLGVLIFGWRLLVPTRLELTPAAIRWFDGRKTHSYSWKDIAEFRAYRPSPRTTSKYIGFEYVPGHPNRAKAAALARALVGVDGGFGGQWEMPAQDLAGLLNEAKRKWG